MHAVAPCSSC